jgi:hypothetical protein
VRQRVHADPAVSIRDGCEVRGLVASPDRRRVVGVRVVPRADDGPEETLSADLVHLRARPRQCHPRDPLCTGQEWRTPRHARLINGDVSCTRQRRWHVLGGRGRCGRGRGLIGCARSTCRECPPRGGGLRDAPRQLLLLPARGDEDSRVLPALAFAASIHDPSIAAALNVELAAAVDVESNRGHACTLPRSAEAALLPWVGRGGWWAGRFMGWRHITYASGQSATVPAAAPAGRAAPKGTKRPLP